MTTDAQLQAAHADEEGCRLVMVDGEQKIDYPPDPPLDKWHGEKDPNSTNKAANAAKEI